MASGIRTLPRFIFVLYAFGIIYQVDAKYQKSYGRRCYDCMYEPSSGNWDKCQNEIKHHEASQIGMDSPICYNNCFVRVTKEGSVRRGCYDGSETNVNPDLEGCQEQNGATYCFCKLDRCNFQAPPSASGDKSVYGHEAEKEALHRYPQPQASETQHTYPEHHAAPSSRKVNYVVDHVSGPGGAKVQLSNHDVEGQIYVPGEPDSSDETFPRGRFAPSYRDYETYNSNNNRYKKNFDFSQSQGNDRENSHQEEVHGVRNLPKVYLVKNGRILTLAQKRKKYRDFGGNRHETDVHVQTQKEHDDRGRTHYEHGGYGDNSLRKRGHDTVSREYIDHTQRQRHIESKANEGTEDSTYGKIGLPQATVKNRQLQHYATFDLGDRTIEHHIVEHYVLHHRIKEQLKNRHGVDIKNIDPRTLSLIYRLLHPHKAQALDKELEKYQRGYKP